MELTANPTPKLDLSGMVSLGNWKYNDNFSARGTNLDTNTPEGEATIFADGLKVGDAAQTTFAIGAGYEIATGFRVYADFYLADNLYAEYDVTDASFYAPGAEVVKLPSYQLVDAGLSYNFDLGGTNMTVRLNVNNVFDELYISELDTNIQDDPSTPINEFYDNRGIFGFGRTWNAGLKFRF